MAAGLKDLCEGHEGEKEDAGIWRVRGISKGQTPSSESAGAPLSYPGDGPPPAPHILKKGGHTVITSSPQYQDAFSYSGYCLVILYSSINTCWD
ncbi:hypothetical protein E2C01_079527 [Portunus trituberculatus]|uniref:Uncharacterized protein n=1 Tax=Portunus trituberculatus TaxID=210409 RepID=A0A5B7IVV7_PORTR|nr:hypothetical protein [Portunus trituberculatus]